ncbi:MAG: glycosyl hydrolase family 28 protein [Candidatus Cryptobacteroides sp.]
MKMRKTGIGLIFLCAAALGLAAQGNNSLTTYPAPEGVEMKDDFKVEARIAGGEWQEIPTYMVKVDEVRDTKHCVEKASLSYFDFEGCVEVRVTSLKSPVTEARIRPLSYGIEHQVDGNTISFSLDCPRNVSVEVNGDIFHNLHLFANPEDGNNPIDGVKIKSVKQLQKQHKDIVYFGPGVHTIPGDTLRMQSGQTVYIAGGAVIFGTVAAIDVENVKVYGRGRVHPRGRGAGVVIKRARNVEVEGIISTQIPTGESNGVTIRNAKVISSYGWGDGLNVFASSNVLMDGCFCRNSDDCTTVYATRLGHRGGCSNITMQNSTLWADVAHPIMIGLHGDIARNEVIENLVYKNIDILDHKEKQIDYQGCMAINCGDNIFVRDVLFEDIRVENFRQGQLIHLKVCYNDKYCKAPGRGIDNVTFRNITYNGTNAEHSVICGYSPERRITNVRFENLVINGEEIWDEMPGKPKWYKTADMARIFVGPNADIPVFSK